MVPRDVQTTGSMHPPGYTAQLRTLYQDRANNLYRTANQIQPILKVSNNTWTFSHSSTNNAWLQWSYDNWYVQVHKLTRPLKHIVIHLYKTHISRFLGNIVAVPEVLNSYSSLYNTGPVSSNYHGGGNILCLCTLGVVNRQKQSHEIQNNWLHGKWITPQMFLSLNESSLHALDKF